MTPKKIRKRLKGKNVPKKNRLLKQCEQKAEVVEQAAALGRELVQAIQNRKIFPGQQEKHDQIFEIMAYLVAAKKDEWPFAYEYCNAKPDPGI